MGAPVSLAHRAQAAMGAAHFTTAIKVLENYKFEERRGSAAIFNERFGRYKMSGNGREWGDYAFAELLDTKAILCFAS
jgi:acyl-CoA reductase-like NAD-dependent aldehyde dehydrogenase